MFDDLDRGTQTAPRRATQRPQAPAGPHWTTYVFLLLALYAAAHLLVIDYVFLRTSMAYGDAMQQMEKERGRR